MGNLENGYGSFGQRFFGSLLIASRESLSYNSLMSEFVTVAKVGAIAEGQGVPFTIGERIVAVFNIGGEYHAIDDICPHMGASLSAGYVEDAIVTCPWHAWRFCVRDGTWCDNPVIKIDRFEVRVVGDEIQVRAVPTLSG